jgi:hypothetical protein
MAAKKPTPTINMKISELGIAISPRTSPHLGEAYVPLIVERELVPGSFLVSWALGQLTCIKPAAEF